MGWDKEKKREWCRKNKDKCCEYERKYREKHATQIRKRYKEYYQNHKEVILEANRRYRTKHSEYYYKFQNMMNKRIHNNVISFEEYDDNIMIATIDIQIEYRTKLERGVIE